MPSTQNHPGMGGFCVRGKQRRSDERIPSDRLLSRICAIPKFFQILCPQAVPFSQSSRQSVSEKRGMVSSTILLATSQYVKNTSSPPLGVVLLFLSFSWKNGRRQQIPTHVSYEGCCSLYSYHFGKDIRSPYRAYP